MLKNNKNLSREQLNHILAAGQNLVKEISSGKTDPVQKFPFDGQGLIMEPDPQYYIKQGLDMKHPEMIEHYRQHQFYWLAQEALQNFRNMPVETQLNFLFEKWPDFPSHVFVSVPHKDQLEHLFGTNKNFNIHEPEKEK